MHHTLQVEHTFHSQRDAAPVHHIIVQSHNKERERRKQPTGRRSQYMYTGLATVFRPNIQLNTQSLNFPLLANATSSRLILKLLLWLLLLPSSNNTTTMTTNSTSSTTIHNKLVETVDRPKLDWPKLGWPKLVLAKNWPWPKQRWSKMDWPKLD